jgi:hypothetical protein
MRGLSSPAEQQLAQLADSIAANEAPRPIAASCSAPRSAQY